MDSDDVDARTRLAETLRDLAWTVHNSVPERAGIQPVPRTELTVLKLVLDQPGITVGELSAASGMRQPNVSAALRRLVERSLVTVVKGEPDRRITRVHPSDRSQRERSTIVETWTGSLGEAFESLPAAQRRSLLGSIDALRALDDRLREIDRTRDDTRQN